MGYGELFGRTLGRQVMSSTRHDNEIDAASGSRDGRLHRSVKTKARIAAAFVALVDEGSLAPTSQEVAERAGVGHRTVFRHFQDMESLYSSILDEIRKIGEPMLAAVQADGPLSGRIRQVVAQRAELHHRIRRFRRALVPRYWTSPTLKELSRRNQQTMRSMWLAALPEAAELTAPEIEALDMLLSFETWARLTEVQGLSAKQARVVMERVVCRMLDVEIRT